MIAETRTATKYLPFWVWLKDYQKQALGDDLFAGIITAILLVPQGIAYAILAGLPPQMGLYASIVPPVIYALLGTSRTLSVGPVSIAAIMIASALAAPEISALNAPMQSALVLAIESGVMMLVMALLRMGSLVNFISHPVLAGFTSGAALLIIASQVPLVLGIKLPVCGVDWVCYLQGGRDFSPATLAVGLGALVFLVLAGAPLTRLMKKWRANLSLITAVSKCGPLLTVILTTLAVGWWPSPDAAGITVVGKVPVGLPMPGWHFPGREAWQLLLPYAGFIGLIAYVESVAIAKVTANLRGEKISPNQELIALGSANVAAAVFGGMPVAGGFSRTMVNFSAGARTQMAMVIAAAILALAVLFFSDWFAQIPKAALAAIILVAIYRLVRFKHIWHTWQYDRGDGMAELATLLGVLVLGIEQGILLGIVLTIASHLRKTSQPHIAVVGRVPDTEHFRNIKHHSVQTWHHLLLVRIDESLTYANVNYIEDYLGNELRRQPNTRHVVLILSSVNDIDATALEALEIFNQGLKATGKTLNLSEAKEPLMEKLQKTDFFAQISPGKVFLRTEDAVKSLG